MRFAQKRAHLIYFLLAFAVLACSLVLILPYFFLNSKPRSSGRLFFSDNISASEQAYYEALLSDVSLTSDLTLFRYFSFSPGFSPNRVLTDVLVPVTDFYSPVQKISYPDLASFSSAYLAQLDSSTPVSVTLDSGLPVSFISVSALDSSVKLLSVDDDYYLDTLSSGAIFSYLIVSPVSDKLPDADAALTPDVQVVLSRLSSSVVPPPTSTFTLAQTGVTALSRNLNSKLAQVSDPTYFSQNLRDFFKNFTLVHTSSESSFSSAASGSNICSNPRFLDTLLDISVSIVELSGNHNLDCGAESALNTLSLYSANGIKYYGGGKNLADARQPLRFKDSSLTLLAFNESTGGATSGDYPGANPYDEDLARSQISEAKARGDLVIVDVQYYECNAYDNESDDRTCDYADSSAGDQISFFRHLIDLGADVVVGTSAHQPQTYEKYKNGEIYYGLGNFLFDQYWWPGTSRSLVLVHYFASAPTPTPSESPTSSEEVSVSSPRLLQTRLYATTYDSNLQPRLMTDDELTAFLARLSSARPE